MTVKPHDEKSKLSDNVIFITFVVLALICPKIIVEIYQGKFMISELVSWAEVISFGSGRTRDFYYFFYIECKSV